MSNFAGADGRQSYTPDTQALKYNQVWGHTAGLAQLSATYSYKNNTRRRMQTSTSLYLASEHVKHPRYPQCSSKPLLSRHLYDFSTRCRAHLTRQY